MAIGLRVAVLAVLCGAAAMGQEWVRLFDGVSLKGWKETPFRARGEVRVKNGTIELGKARLTGITWTGEFPKTGYEVRFEAVRLEGNDMFGSITFPVGDSFCTWVNGGWDGTVVGLSNLDGDDASENDTSTARDFVTGRWYAFRLEVREERIRGWIDGVLVVDADIKGRRVELREVETELCAPLGFMAYRTVGGLRNIEYRKLPGAI
jgi:hypothetical protein